MNQQRHTLMILSSILMMLLMGTVYAYSVFRYHIEVEYQVGTFLSGLPYMTSLFFYALSMMVSGRLLRPSRLRRFVFFGTIMISMGWFISSLSTEFVVLVIAYGFLIGTGVGMVYGVPIYMVQKLYPKKSGWMTGIILLGFGMSPLLTAPLASILIQSTSLQTTFLIFSILFLVIQLPLSFLLILKEYTDFKSVIPDPFLHEKLKPFKRIYALFVIATTIGLMMIGLSYQIGVVHYGFDAREVMLSLSFFALMNGLARPLFGKLMDQKGFRFSVLLSLSLLSIASLIGILNQGQHIILYIISFGLFWFNLGAWLAIVPATIKEFYGIKQYSRKYGVMFTAYGIGSILGTLISGTIMDVLGWTGYLYVMVLFFIGISMVIVFKINQTSLKHPDKSLVDMTQI
ncbi:MAG: MFS transporter [Acholeplasmataceae bacterium]|nr:MFS transporter [Acholeplasmataceae bacterium]